MFKKAGGSLVESGRLGILGYLGKLDKLGSQ